MVMMRTYEDTVEGGYLHTNETLELKLSASSTEKEIIPISTDARCTFKAFQPTAPSSSARRQKHSSSTRLPKLRSLR